jgi:hypothetical protein
MARIAVPEGANRICNLAVLPGEGFSFLSSAWAASNSAVDDELLLLARRRRQEDETLPLTACQEMEMAGVLTIYKHFPSLIIIVDSQLVA